MSIYGSFNPWAKIWVQPRATIDRIVRENPNRGLWWLAIIYGFSSLLNSFQSLALGEQIGLIPLFFLAAILSPIWGYVAFSIWSFFVLIIGKCFKGLGTFKEVRAAYAWSCVPFIINVILWVVLACLFGRLLFMNISESTTLTPNQVWTLFPILILRVGTAIWSLVIYLNALAQVQRYSVWRAVGNILIAGILVAGLFYLVLYAGFKKYDAMTKPIPIEETMRPQP